MDNRVQLNKATYGVPHALFPSDEIVARWFQEGNWTPFEQKVRALAFSAYVNKDAPDKELTRFMVPSITWADVDYRRSSCTPLGESSWIASADQVPFIPSVCKELLANVSQEPRSLMHLIGATFTHMHILYIAESLEKIVLENSPGARELLFVIAEPGVSVTIVDTVHVADLSARTVIGNVAPGALVSWVSDLSADRASLLQHDRWYQGEGSHLEIAQVLTGGQQSWLRKEFTLGEEAHMSYTCLAALQGDEQSALTTVQEHLGHASTSSVVVKAALSQRARSFYRGTIAIHPEGSKSVASQQQRALLLSPEVRTCAIPSLEVATHEVQCAHGSAAGQFNQDELWYVRSKGLSTEQAQRLLIEGFFNEPIALQNPEMRERLLARILFR